MKRNTNKNLLLTTSKFIQQRKYWLRKLSGDIDAVKISLSSKHETPSQDRETVELVIPHHISSRLLERSKESDLSIYIILLTVLKILLYRYTGRGDIMVISPLFMPNVSQDTLNNRLLVRDKINGRMAFRDVLLKIRQSVLEAYENQDYPLDELLEELELTNAYGVGRTLWRPNEACLLRNIHGHEQGEGIKETLIFSFHRESQLVQGRILYDPGVYEKGEVEQLSKHFLAILTVSIREVNTKIAALQFLSDEERKQLMFTFNNTSRDYPGDKCIHELFADQVERTPDHTALHGEDVSVTYRELNKRSNNLAFYLREKGVTPNTIAAVMVERSIGMILAIFGILKAGGAYLPINPDHPADRIDYLLADSRAKVLVNTSTLAGIDFSGFADFSTSHLLNFSSPGPCDLAYVIYTSGSTGRPKGAEIEHYSLVNRLLWMQRKYPIHERDVLLLKADFTFDVSVMEIFWPLIQGAKLCLLEQGGEKDLTVLLKALEEHAVSYMHFIPSMLDRVLDHLEGSGEANRVSCLKRITVGGEALREDTVRKFKRLLYETKGIMLHNMYGLTEATIDVTYYDCPLERELEMIPIGKPIDNIRIYILDKDENVMPIGVPGQLCLAGDGLARGYLNNPGLTAEAFTRKPQISRDWVLQNTNKKGPGKKIYMTGDLARWLPDGNIEFLGRMDDQVNLRGYRIELGEIVKPLLTHEKIKEAVVIGREMGKGDTYLCAYIVTADVEPAHEAQTMAQELSEYLLQFLPGYMIPTYFIQLDKIPLTPSGKVKRSALPGPEIDKGGAYTAPNDEVEKKLVQTWSEVLGIEERIIGIDTNFFELGGHSLKAISLMSKIQKEFDVVVSLVEFFKAPVIRQLAKAVKESEKNRFKAIRPVEKKEYYEVSSAQRRLYILYKMAPGSIRYNMPKVVELEGEPDRSKLEKIFIRLINRHEGFRTSFETIAGEPFQQIHESVEFELEYYGANGSVPDPAGVTRDFIRPFDLSQAPLLRVGLIKLRKNRHILMVDMHHIISDGTSLNMIVGEFMALYEGNELPGLRIQYKDFSEWQRSETMEQVLKKQEEYWMGQHEKDLSKMSIPMDFPKTGQHGQQNFTGIRSGFAISSGEAKALKEFSLKQKVTTYMVLLAIYNIFLWKVSGCEAIVVGTAVNGRLHPDLEPVIGMFVNMLALRNRLAQEKTFKEFLLEVKESTLQAFGNQDYPFDDLVEKVAKERDIGSNPLFDVVFAFNTSDEEAALHIPGLKLRPSAHQRHTSKFDLVLFAVDAGENLSFCFEYNSALFKEETILRYKRYFKEIVATLLTNNDILLQEIKITHELLMPKSNIRQIDFNF